MSNLSASCYKVQITLGGKCFEKGWNERWWWWGGGAEVAVVVCKSSWGFAGKETLMLRNKKHM